MADVFTTTETPNGFELVVNGTSKGRTHTEQTLGDFAVSKAREAGIRTFSVYIDGTKATTDDSARSLSGASKVEIVAKDSRA